MVFGLLLHAPRALTVKPQPLAQDLAPFDVRLVFNLLLVVDEQLVAAVDAPRRAHGDGAARGGLVVLPRDVRVAAVVEERVERVDGDAVLRVARRDGDGVFSAVVEDACADRLQDPGVEGEVGEGVDAEEFQDGDGRDDVRGQGERAV